MALSLWVEISTYFSLSLSSCEAIAISFGTHLFQIHFAAVNSSLSLSHTSTAKIPIGPLALTASRSIRFILKYHSGIGNQPDRLAASDILKSPIWERVGRRVERELEISDRGWWSDWEESIRNQSSLVWGWCDAQREMCVTKYVFSPTHDRWDISWLISSMFSIIVVFKLHRSHIYWGNGDLQKWYSIISGMGVKDGLQ